MASIWVPTGENKPITADHVKQALSEEQIGQIVELQVADLRNRLGDLKLELELTPAAKEWLAREGFDPSYGARPLRRTIQRQVENPLAKRILAGEFKDGDTVLIDLGQSGLTFAKGELATNH